VEEQICDEVIRHPDGYRNTDYSEDIVGAVVRFRRTGLLHEKDTVLDFSAPLLRSCYFQSRLGSTIRAGSPPDNIDDFILKTFTLIDPFVLAQSLGIGTDGRLLERTWQMEFYRAATRLLPKSDVLSPDVGAWFNSPGYLDFWVGGSRKWAIELLRDGNKVSEHLDRANGLYVEIITGANVYKVIDIRKPGSKPPQRLSRENLVTVICGDMWKEVTIYGLERHPEGKTVSLNSAGQQYQSTYEKAQFIPDAYGKCYLHPSI
jgi:hypothetical protein